MYVLSSFQYVFKHCHGDVNNYNVVTYDSSMINYCSVKDVPTEFNFTKISAKNEKGELIGTSIILMTNL